MVKSREKIQIVSTWKAMLFHVMLRWLSGARQAEAGADNSPETQ